MKKYRGKSISNYHVLGPLDDQAPQSTEFSRQESWSGCPFPSPGDLPNPGIEPRSATLQAGSLPADPQDGAKKLDMGRSRGGLP